MKKLVLVLSLMLFAFAGYSQEIVIDQKDIPPEILAKIKADKELQLIDERIAQMGEWAGKGKEIGIAVKEGLTAVKDVAVDFSGTDVGLFTMVLIAWHIVADDIIEIGGSLIRGTVVITIMIFMTYFYVKSYFKTCTSQKHLTSDPGFMKYPKTYEYEEPYYDRDSAAQSVHFVSWAIFMGILISIMFI